MIVFSDGPVGPTAVEQKSAVAASVYVEYLEAAGHGNIRVGTDEANSIPFHVWRAKQTPPQMGTGPDTVSRPKRPAAFGCGS